MSVCSICMFLCRCVNVALVSECTSVYLRCGSRKSTSGDFLHLIFKSLTDPEAHPLAGWLQRATCEHPVTTSAPGLKSQLCCPTAGFLGERWALLALSGHLPEPLILPFQKAYRFHW